MKPRCEPKLESRAGSSSRSSLAGLTFGLFAFSALGCAGVGSTADELSVSSESLVQQELTEDTARLWRDHILAPDEELEWEKIPWHPSFLTGLREAARLEKPVLLWVMNGHPLGCT